MLAGRFSLQVKTSAVYLRNLSQVNDLALLLLGGALEVSTYVGNSNNTAGTDNISSSVPLGVVGSSNATNTSSTSSTKTTTESTMQMSAHVTVTIRGSHISWRMPKEEAEALVLVSSWLDNVLMQQLQVGGCRLMRDVVYLYALHGQYGSAQRVCNTAWLHKPESIFHSILLILMVLCCRFPMPSWLLRGRPWSRWWWAC